MHNFQSARLTKPQSERIDAAGGNLSRGWRQLTPLTTTKHDGKRCCRQAAKSGYVNTDSEAIVSKLAAVTSPRRVLIGSKSFPDPFVSLSLNFERCFKYLCQKLVFTVHEWLLNLLTAPTRVAPPTHDVGGEALSDWPRTLRALVNVVTFLQRAPSAP